ncbi:hypothetical protein OIU76_020803 [Salix suchowensis]|nr:hypothetical protein OIU76_020803 [Salix suchowensis]
MLSSVSIGLVSGRCHDQRPLLELRNSLTFDQRPLSELRNSPTFDQRAYTKMVKWNSTPDCCEWPGITCDEGGSGRVISLDLSFAGITGGIDDSSGLFSLQFLQNLNLSVNTSASQIPNGISKLTKLVSLDLSTNSFFGGPALKLEKPNLATLVQNLAQLEEFILDGVNISAQGSDWGKALSSSLPNLKVLSMSNCFLSGPLDASLAELRSLSIFRLSSNNLSAPVPEFLANYPKLTALELSSCQLNGIFPQNVFQIPTLEILDLSSNELLQGSFPEFHQNLSLQTLLISYTNFSGTLPQSIGNLEKLSRIELYFNNFTGTIPSSVANLTQLFSLDLSFNKFEGRIPSFRKSKNLNYADLSDNQLTGEIPSFRKSKNLTYVDLSRNNLTGEIPSGHWEGLLSVTYVGLRSNAFNGSIPSSLFAFPSMQRILLSNNRFGGQIPEFPNVSSSLLDTLDFSSNKLEGPIPSSVFDLANLNVLELSSNKLNGTVELHLIQKLSNLTTLDLSYNNLTVIASELSLLGYLNLSRNLLVGLERPLSLPGLDILDLHHNQLQGSIPAPPSLITYVDYSSNNFSSYIPPNIGMMEGENRHLEYINYELDGLYYRGLYYQDSITVTFKALELELVKITFSANSFEGNQGLCGPPSNLVCFNPLISACSNTNGSISGIEIDWNFLSAELGYIFGLGIVILPLMFCKRWRTWYCTHVDRVIFRVFPQLDKRSNNLGRRAQRNRRRQ